VNRRHFLLLSAASLWAAARAGASDRRDEALCLWPGEPPGGGGPSGAPRLSARGALTHIARPQLTVWRPALSRGHGVLIAAGGGYRRIEMAKEAWPAARWLTARGYTAYVLSYRLPGEGWGAGALAPLQDAQRALRLIRAGRTGQPAGVFRRRAFAGYGGLPGRFCRLFAAGCPR
jgi:acetyl esterase/lipase